MIETNKIYLGDYLEVIKKIKKVNMVLSDPPYLYEKGGNSKLFDCVALGREKRTMLNSEFGEKEIYEFLDSTKPLMDKPQWYLFCSEKQLGFYISWANKNEFLFNVLVWCKPLTILNKNRFSTNIEYIVRLYEWGVPLNDLDSSKNHYYSKHIRQRTTMCKFPKLHPQQKPTFILEQLIELSSKKGDLILDCFGGSGSTAEACIKQKRKFILIEKTQEYYDVSVKRIDNYHRNPEFNFTPKQ